MTQNLFEDQGDPQIDDTSDHYAELVGEGKKYKDNAALAKAILAKDAFIEQLKSETAGLRTDLSTRIKLEEFLDKMNSTQRPTQQAADNHAENSQEKPAVTTLEDVKKVIAQERAEAARQANLLAVAETLQKNFGPNFASRLREATSQLGMSEAAMQELAASNPQAFYKLVGVGEKTKETFEAPPRGTSRPPQEGSGRRNRAYYQKLQRENPVEYWSPRIQNEEFQEAQRQGDAFYS